MTDLACFRVPVSRGERSIAPIIAAHDAEEATERAQTLGPSVLRASRKLGWVRSDWSRASRPAPDTAAPLEVGAPVLLHRAGSHP